MRIAFMRCQGGQTVSSPREENAIKSTCFPIRGNLKALSPWSACLRREKNGAPLATPKPRSFFRPPRFPVPTAKRIYLILQDSFFLTPAHGLAQTGPVAKTFMGAKEGEGEEEGHEIIYDPEQHQRSE